MRKVVTSLALGPCRPTCCWQLRPLTRCRTVLLRSAHYSRCGPFRLTILACAVQALDGAIMARFNEFLWAMEQAQAGTFPLASFELDEEHHDDEQLPRFDPGVYATGA